MINQSCNDSGKKRQHFFPSTTGTKERCNCVPNFDNCMHENAIYNNAFCFISRQWKIAVDTHVPNELSIYRKKNLYEVTIIYTYICGTSILSYFY
jgi:hypothetical protein